MPPCVQAGWELACPPADLVTGSTGGALLLQDQLSAILQEEQSSQMTRCFDCPGSYKLAVMKRDEITGRPRRASLSASFNDR